MSHWTHGEDPEIFHHPSIGNEWKTRCVFEPCLWKPREVRKIAIFRIQHINDIHVTWFLNMFDSPTISFPKHPGLSKPLEFFKLDLSVSFRTTNKNPLRLFDWCGELVDFWVDPWLIFDCKFEGKYIVCTLPDEFPFGHASLQVLWMLVFGRVKMHQFHGYFSLKVQPPSFLGWFTNHLFYSKGLSSSKKNHHFLTENDFQAMIYVDIFLVFLGLLIRPWCFLSRLGPKF